MILNKNIEVVVIACALVFLIMQIAAMFFPPPINAEKERSWDPSWVVVVVFANAILCYLSPRPELGMDGTESMQKLL